jgi:hypothetical protein
MKVTYSELPLGLQKVIELVYHLIELQVRPIKQYRQEEMSQNPDITDVIS